MSFIIKNRRLIETTTTTTTTITSTTTTTLNVIPISDENIFIGGFPAISAVGNLPTFIYNFNSPMFDEFPMTTGGGIGDVNMEILVNNTTFTDRLDGTYEINVDVELLYKNTNQSPSPFGIRRVELPRLAIDLPINNLRGTLSTFTPNSSVTPLRVYSSNRVVVEFDSIQIPPNNEIVLSANGSAILMDTTHTPIPFEFVELEALGTNENTDQFDFSITRTFESTLFDDTLNVNMKFLHRNNILDQNEIIPSNALAKQFTYTPNFYISGQYGSGIIRVDNVNTPRYLINPNNIKGYDEVVFQASPTTTTTLTTTQAPVAAQLSFKVSGFPSTTPAPPSATVDNGDILTYVIQVDDPGSFTTPIPYRVTLTAIGSIGLANPVGNVGGDSGPTYTSGDILEDTTILDGTLSTVTATFFNIGTLSGGLAIQLIADVNNDGNYIPQDSLLYNVNP